MRDDFIPGQRWISDAELQMGLGTVLAADRRSVTVVFLATGETRTYARQSAPLTRVVFGPGDTVPAHDGWALRVESVRNEGGLLTYVGRRDDGRPAQLPEGELDNFIQLNRPAERLFSGQLDAGRWFELRLRTWQQNQHLSQSELRGLTGGRTSLISHQLFIAHEVARRYAPRVLLADEVGLGKTIEAGLILHHQWITERARRVLIVVPDSLLHQWLVEMQRRFNLGFSIFDESRCAAIEESAEQANPFLAEQLILCPLSFLVQHPARFRQALDCAWDLLVVDEAHHLEWTPQEASVEYQVVEQLAFKTRGVLLLTATPEQLGKQAHFARLRLLDPDRFPDFDQFVAEEQGYEPVARAVEQLLSGQSLDSAAYRTLLDTIEEGDNQGLLDTVQDAQTSESEKHAARQALVEHLVDRHGTSRVLFRNTRLAVHGFPGRTVAAYPLPLPDAYEECLAEFQASGVWEPRWLLCPELLYQATHSEGSPHWTGIDPRVDWLVGRLKQLRPAKVLLIAASAETAMDLAEALRVKAGIHAPVFHEHLSLVERDRAAAYFADPEFGSQVLICSEIGSEGRNFQFAHHLVLFDLPLNPDLLEQRIGRLDRIGQRETIRIHVPYLEDSPQAVLFHWYHQGLAAFEHTCPAGHSVFVQVEQTLREALHQLDEGLADLEALVATTQGLLAQFNEALHRGRDRLLEYNSCRPAVAAQLTEQARRDDAQSTLPDYLDAVFDCFGVESEEHSEGSLIIRPSPHMHTAHVPGLPEGGMTVTTQRDIALANEDMQFLTWDHPLVRGAMEMIMGSELGNSAMASIKAPGFDPGTLLLETVYLLETASTDRVQAGRYLPPTAVRMVIDPQGRDHAERLGPDFIGGVGEAVEASAAQRIVRAYTQAIRDMLSTSESLAREQVPAILEAAKEKARRTLLPEVDRLKALSQVNPNVRMEEVRFFEDQWQAVGAALASASLRLDAVRVLVTT